MNMETFQKRVQDLMEELESFLNSYPEILGGDTVQTALYSMVHMRMVLNEQEFVELIMGLAPDGKDVSKERGVTKKLARILYKSR